MENSNDSTTTSAAGADSSTLQPSCTGCKKSPPVVSLKHCAKCSTTPYCSRDCQKADWKSHKKTCGKGRPASAGTQASPPDAPIAPIKKIKKPFTHLDNGTRLHGRPEEHVYWLLIEAYRLCMDDNYVHDGNADADSIYGGAPDGLAGFRRFLKMLRMFAEAVYKRGLGGRDGTNVRKMMAANEGVTMRESCRCMTYRGACELSCVCVLCT